MEQCKSLSAEQSDLTKADAALHQWKDRPELIKNKLRLLHEKALEDFELPEFNGGYLYYLEGDWQEHLGRGLLVLPAEVFGSEEGIVVSTLRKI